MHIVWASTITSCFRRVFLLGPRAQNNIWCVYLEIRTIVGLLAYRRLSTNPSCHRSPSPLILSNVSISSSRSDISRLSSRRGQAGRGRPSPAALSLGFYPIKVKLDAILGGSVLIVMHARSHMTVNTCVRTNQGRRRSGFH